MDPILKSLVDYGFSYVALVALGLFAWDTVKDLRRQRDAANTRADAAIEALGALVDEPVRRRAPSGGR